MPRVSNIWLRFLTYLRELVEGGPQLAKPAGPPQVVVDVTDLLQLRPRCRTVVVAGVNKPAPLTDQDSEIVYGLELVAGPLADGLTPNTSTVWVGGADLQLDAGGGVTKGAPLVPGAERRWDTVDLAELFIMSATGTDVVRLLYLAAV